MKQNKYIQEALNLAKQNTGSDEIPVGCIIVHNEKIIASATNKKEENNDITAHAEILAIKQASELLNRWRLNDVQLYVTLEPCPMCATAILYSRIPQVYFGAYDQLYGAFGTAMEMRNLIKHKTNVVGGIEEENCSALLKDFFKDKRNSETKIR